jgi:hypothetical protein
VAVPIKSPMFERVFPLPLASVALPLVSSSL